LRYYRPLPFFGFLALFFMLAGMIAGIQVIEDWLTSRYIYHVPLAILASALEIVGVMMLGIGFILDSVVHQQRIKYERHLLEGYRSPTMTRLRS
jgi:hypothetical protein